MVGMYNRSTHNILKRVAEPEESLEDDSQNVENPVRLRRFNAFTYVRERFYGQNVTPRLV